MMECRVFLLDESEIEIAFNVHDEGKELLDRVCQHINLVEKDYFGLTVKDEASSNKVWIRPDKTIKKQFSVHPASWLFNFAVKFYPTDPFYLKEEITKYQLCLQIRDDLMCGRLTCPLETLVILSSYWLQSEFGDHEEESIEVKQFLASFQYMSGSEKVIPGFEDKIRKLYISRRGMPPCDADTQFLRLASGLPLYGLHRYVTTGKDGSEKIIGVGSGGVYEINDKDRPLKYKWGTIKNINYKKQKFYVKLLRSSPEGRSEKHTYKLTSSHLAKALWRDAVDQHVFFRVTESDSTSFGPTVKTAAETDRGKPISKKMKTGFRLSFRKKQPTTEAQVRAQSAKIERPNPTVVRHSSQGKSDILSSSQKSVKSDSWESCSRSSSSSSSSYAEDKKRKPKSSTSKSLVSPLRSILKTNKSSESSEGGRSFEAVDGHEDSDEEGRPFTNEDFLDDDGDPKKASHGACSLLLTKTIMEEDEETDESRKASPIVKECVLSTSSKVNGSREWPEVTIEFQPDPDISECIPQEENHDKMLVCPVVTVEVCPEPDSKKKSLKPSQENESTLLSPPLVRKLTREAILPYVIESKLSDDNDKDNSLVVDGTMEARLKAEKLRDEVLSLRNDESDRKPGQRSDLVLSSRSPEARISPPSLLEGDLNRNGARNDDDDEDDRKTLGAGSAIAVLGDDDITIKDLADDVTIGDLTEYSRGRSDVADDDSQEDNESKITASSGTSISDLTDNTEELCSPNILEIIWSKCSRNRDYGYREIFGVKLRHVKGRSRRVKSSYLDLDEQVSVATQVPTPPLANGSTDNTTTTTEKSTSRGKIFIPSWPFDPDSLALNTNLDELDKEAIKAALRAQVDLQEEEKIFESNSDFGNSAMPTSVSQMKLRLGDLAHETEHSADRKIEHEMKIGESKFKTKGDLPDSSRVTYRDGTPRSVADSIPGIPIFTRSVLRSSETTSLDESRRTSISSVSSQKAEPQISSEELVYPPSIQTYQTKVQESPKLLVYQPDVTAKLMGTIEESKRSILGTGGKKVDLVEDATQTSHSVIKLEDLTRTEEGDQDHLDEATQTLEDVESGRSTPSSVSSFPRFVHSIFPLRKMSSTSEANSSSHKDQVKMARNLSQREDNDIDDNESTSSLSECSVKSVRGSILETNECEVEEVMLPSQEHAASGQCTQITIIDFINENCPPDQAQGGSVHVNLEILRVKEGDEPAEMLSATQASSASREADYAEDAVQDSEESSIDTSPNASFRKDVTANPLPSYEKFNQDTHNRNGSASSPEAWSTVTNVTTSDEGSLSPLEQGVLPELNIGVSGFRMDGFNALFIPNNPSTTDEDLDVIVELAQASTMDEQSTIMVIENNKGQDTFAVETEISTFDAPNTGPCEEDETDTLASPQDPEIQQQRRTCMEIVTVENGSSNGDDSGSETTDDGEFNLDGNKPLQGGANKA